LLRICSVRLQYSTQGFHPEKWQDLTTTLEGPEVKIFQEACKKNKVGDQHNN
jgi:amidase